jgi:hypothetical protein
MRFEGPAAGEVQEHAPQEVVERVQALKEQYELDL